MATIDPENGTDEPLTVEQSSLGMTVRAVGSFVFVGICGMIVSPGGVLTDPPTLVWGISVVGVIFFGFTGLWSFIKALTTLLTSKPALVIDSEGLRDHSSALPAGHLHWNEIDRIALVTVMGTPMLAISPTDISGYLAQHHPLKRLGMRINLVLVDAPVAIAFNNVPIARDDLLAAIEQHHSIENASFDTN